MWNTGPERQAKDVVKARKRMSTVITVTGRRNTSNGLDNSNWFGGMRHTMLCVTRGYIIIVRGMCLHRTLGMYGAESTRARVGCDTFHSITL